MLRRRRTWFLLIALIGVALAVYFEPSHCVRGWLRGEAFYDGRPTSYWAAEIEQWDYSASGESNAMTETWSRRPPWPRWLERFLPKAEWPRLLDGDADALQVLQELCDYPSAHVRYSARMGIGRMDNCERGPSRYWGFPDQ